MSISIQLPPELEEKLRKSAEKAGLDVNRYVVEILEGQLTPQVSREVGLEERASELLEKISLGIPVGIWKRYNYLKDLRDREQLDPEEHAELIRISDQIEEANAERMQYLVELASIKEVSINDLMSSLGIKPGANG